MKAVVSPMKKSRPDYVYNEEVKEFRKNEKSKRTRRQEQRQSKRTFAEGVEE